MRALVKQKVGEGIARPNVPVAEVPLNKLLGMAPTDPLEGRREHSHRLIASGFSDFILTRKFVSINWRQPYNELLKKIAAALKVLLSFSRR